MDARRKRRLARGFLRVADAWEPRFGRAAERQFGRDRERFAAALREAGGRKQYVAWDEVLMAWQDIYTLVGSQWRSTFVPLMRGVVTTQCEQQSLALGMAFNVENLLAQAWFDEYVMAFAAEVIGETERELAGLLRQGQAEGWSIPTMERNMGLMFRQWAEGGLTPAAFEWLEQRMPRYRREMIARTEVIKSSSAGSDALYGQWGVQYKEWLATVGDPRTCEWCLAMHGTLIPVGGTFWEKGQTMTVQVGDKPQTMTFNYESIKYPPLHPLCR